MVANEPIQKGKGPVSTDNLSRSARAIAETRAHVTPAATPRPLGGRRISFLAWGLASVAGIVLWIAIFKII